MLHTIVIEHVTAVEALALAQELHSHGLTRDQDYAWRFVPRNFDHLTTADPSRVEFDFVHNHLATFFAVKWARYHTYHK